MNSQMSTSFLEVENVSFFGSKQSLVLLAKLKFIFSINWRVFWTSSNFRFLLSIIFFFRILLKSVEENGLWEVNFLLLLKILDKHHPSIVIVITLRDSLSSLDIWTWKGKEWGWLRPFFRVKLVLKVKIDLFQKPL